MMKSGRFLIVQKHDPSPRKGQNQTKKQVDLDLKEVLVPKHSIEKSPPTAKSTNM